MHLLARMPLYALRAYDKIWEEGGYTLISTAYNTYVLDCKQLDGEYARRRLLLASMELPYKLYRIDERYTTLAQLLTTKRTKMVDKFGCIVRYKKSRFVKVHYTKVLRTERTWRGNYRLSTKLPVPFVTSEPAEYVGYVEDGHGHILFELCDELKPTRRVKI